MSEAVIDPARHVPLAAAPWDAAEVSRAIDEIVADTLAHANAAAGWPAHPMDEHVADGHASFYVGATGVLWALHYLQRVGATHLPIDLRPALPPLLARIKAEFTRENLGEYAEHGSLLFGDMGTALLAMRIDPRPEHAALIARRVAANDELPLRELMWGTPGSMLACVHMGAMTGEARWERLFRAQAARLLGELEETELGPLWTQDLYGGHSRWLGPVHGYAGNMIPLLRGWAWLTAAQRDCVSDAVPRTLAGTAIRCEHGATWQSRVDPSRPANLCQHCHGAPGMVTTFADAPFAAPQLDALLIEGGNFAWAAGPLAKGSNLCHGTGGNGYAFLKLYRRTGDVVWRERARAFAMTAIAQCRAARAALGRGRFTLWTGDPGLAVYLWDCLTEEPRFPTIDVF
ncbi:MAG TPA: LanC-like protein [Xanthobacteraceae bacterium]|nr:LanC-like protein [Xanthobacteraceae bacterium]